MENFYINHWAVIVSAFSSLVIGGLWYSPVLFYKGWQKANNFSDEDLKKVNPAVTYSVSFVIALIMSYNLAFFLGDTGTDWKWGMTAGFLAGFGFAALMFAIIALFEMRSWRYILINGGYMVVWFTLIGFILGIWR
jgi:membrane protein YdbS with pleckstrin-like domain